MDAGPTYVVSSHVNGQRTGHTYHKGTGEREKRDTNVEGATN